MDAKQSVSKIFGGLAGSAAQSLRKKRQVIFFEKKRTRPNEIISIRPELEESGLTEQCNTVINGRIVFVEKLRDIAQADVREQLAKAKGSGLHIAFSG